jgi:hypothetical protein
MTKCLKDYDVNEPEIGYGDLLERKGMSQNKIYADRQFFRFVNQLAEAINTRHSGNS